MEDVIAQLIEEDKKNNFIQNNIMRIKEDWIRTRNDIKTMRYNFIDMNLFREFIIKNSSNGVIKKSTLNRLITIIEDYIMMLGYYIEDN